MPKHKPNSRKNSHSKQLESAVTSGVDLIKSISEQPEDGTLWEKILKLLPKIGKVAIEVIPFLLALL
jgi:hypothetical protein